MTLSLEIHSLLFLCLSPMGPNFSQKDSCHISAMRSTAGTAGIWTLFQTPVFLSMPTTLLQIEQLIPMWLVQLESKQLTAMAFVWTLKWAFRMDVYQSSLKQEIHLLRWIVIDQVASLWANTERGLGFLCQTVRTCNWWCGLLAKTWRGFTLWSLVVSTFAQLPTAY